MPLPNRFPRTRAQPVSQLAERIFTDNDGSQGGVVEGSSGNWGEIYTTTLTPASLQPFRGKVLSLVVSFDYTGPSLETSKCRLMANEVQVGSDKNVNNGSATNCQFVIWDVPSTSSIKFDIDGSHTSGNAANGTVANFQVTARMTEA